MDDFLIHNAQILTLDDQGIIDNGFLVINKGKIVQIGDGTPPGGTYENIIDADNMIVMPGLVDCHTHLMEYATIEIHHTYGSAQKIAAMANLLSALKSGIVALGEHHLGHPQLPQSFQGYKQIISDNPVDIKLASGCCFIGTDPLVLVSSTAPATVIEKEDLNRDMFVDMAKKSDFPGENIFLNATVANLPLDEAPRAGELTFSYEEIKVIVEIFHACNKRIGAHLEGDDAAEMFINAGGDVIYHGHNLTDTMVSKIADIKIPVVITPHGGTSSKPTSPEEVYRFYKQGIMLAIASDSYIPVHPGAEWINIPSGKLAGPEDFMKICEPVLNYLIENGVELSEALKLITLNGRKILDFPEKNWSLSAGNNADIIISKKIPAIETVDVYDIKYVIKSGKLVINRIQ